jgi:hypothetical protein
MKTPDDTYNALIRTSFSEVVNLIYADDPNGSYTFNRMNADKKWRVQSCYEYIVVKEGWKVKDFNNELQKYYDNKQS